MNDSSVTDRMKAQLSAWEGTSDRRSAFLNCYLLMTQNVLRAIEAGEFHDGAWVSAFLRRFAGYYFEALEAYARRDLPTPAVWQVTLDAAQRPQTMVVQNLLLGVNAHINYDLVLTLVDTLEPEWEQLSAGQREKRRSDHDRINDIIGRTVDSVQDTVLERDAPWMDVVDKVLGPVDEWLASRLIAHWRTRDWELAIRWIETPDPEGREKLRLEIEAGALRLAEGILLGQG